MNEKNEAEATASRLRFLNDAAHRMLLISPEISRYLMSRSNDLLFSEGLAVPESHCRHVCAACGNILTPGWTVKTDTERQRQRKRSRQSKTQRSEPASSTRSIVYICDCCSAKTRFELNVSSRRPQRGSKSGLYSASPFAGSENPRIGSAENSVENQVLSANASSKKRARARKRGGLEALLASGKGRNEQSQSSGFGLDLMDMMKKS